jgi:hypothetical protein
MAIASSWRTQFFNGAVVGAQVRLPPKDALLLVKR